MDSSEEQYRLESMGKKTKRLHQAILKLTTSQHRGECVTVELMWQKYRECYKGKSHGKKKNKTKTKRRNWGYVNAFRILNKMCAERTSSNRKHF